MKRKILKIPIGSAFSLDRVPFNGCLSSTGEKLTVIMIERGYEEVSTFKIVFWQFLWGFTYNMVIRFEPFLMGAYLYFRRGGI